MTILHPVDTARAQLAPPIVWRHFDALCRIPRPSQHEDAVRSHVVNWAAARGLATEVDAIGNLLVRKPGQHGGEQAETLVLQNHLDMVCQKNEGVTHDFLRDPIQTVIEGEWLRAPGTTLGADNGMGVALALALLEDMETPHGPLEVLFTVDEEAGMGGAHGLQAGWLQGRRMLNLDTEEWGEFFLGCAGGLDVNVTRHSVADAVPPGWQTWQVSLTGLRGGHSGVNIHEERGNAIKLLVRVLHGLQAATDCRWASLNGGTARNALPREAFAMVAIPPQRAADMLSGIESWQATLHAELADTEPGLSLQARPAATPAAALLSPSEQHVWCSTLVAAPHGVHRMSQSLAGVVETSNNLGVVQIQPQGGEANFMVRSLRDSAAQALGEQIAALWSLSHSDVTLSGHYPGWTPNPASPLLAICQQVFHELTGQASTVQVIHAGLECGLIQALYPDMDIVSFGPTIRGAHAPGEAVHIPTVASSWQLLRAIARKLSS